MMPNGLTEAQDTWAHTYINAGVKAGVLARSHDDILRYAGGCGDAYLAELGTEAPIELWWASHAYMFMALHEATHAPPGDLH